MGGDAGAVAGRLSSVCTLTKGQAKKLRGEVAQMLRPFSEVSKLLSTARANVLCAFDAGACACLELEAFLSQAPIECRFGDHVAEVCSPPRVVTQARTEGMTGSLSIDLVTGWDLATSDGQNRAWRQLEKKDPLLTISNPPCTMFSILQNLNPKFMNSDTGKRLFYHLGLRVLEFCMKVAEWCLLSGRCFIFDTLAELPVGQELASRSSLRSRGSCDTLLTSAASDLKPPMDQGC